LADEKDKYAEALRQTERLLDSQLAAEAARDQRALVVVAFSVASAGFSLRAAGEGPAAFTWAAVVFGMAALVGALAALPREFHGAGYRHATLRGALAQAEDAASLLRSLAVKNDEYIALNARAGVLMANLYRGAIILFAVGTFIALFGVAAGGPEGAGP
jgi:hypothetical protein